MTGDELERAIEFILRNQAKYEALVAQNENRFARNEERIAAMDERIAQTQAQLAETQAQLAELTRLVQLQAKSQAEFNETITRTVSSLAEMLAQTDSKVNRLAGIVEKLVERLSS